MREGGHVEHRVLVGERVVAGMVPEWPFGATLARFHVTFQHDLGVGRHLEIDGAALHHVHRLAAQEAREHHLVDDAREWSGGRVGDGGVGADGHGYLQAPAGGAIVVGCVLVQVPMHAGRAGVVDLQAVHARVAHARARIPGEDHRKGDEPSAVQRPALQHG